MHRGYIKLWKKFKENQFWTERRVFSKFEAWLDIISEARYQEEPGQVVIGNSILTVNRGECLYSLDTWAYRWGWSRSKVVRVLDLFKKCSQIDTISETVTTRIRVLNYSKYADERNADETQTESKRKANGKQTETSIELKKVKKEKRDVSKDTSLSGNGARHVPYLEVISFLNEHCKTDYKANTTTTRNLIKARFNQGFTLEDFQKVISCKAKQWLTNPKMVVYLRPQTLFGNKFESDRKSTRLNSSH
jgi:uncharacterized phage protein (TIGR02220 family)